LNLILERYTGQEIYKFLKIIRRFLITADRMKREE